MARTGRGYRPSWIADVHLNGRFRAHAGRGIASANVKGVVVKLN